MFQKLMAEAWSGNDLAVRNEEYIYRLNERWYISKVVRLTRQEIEISLTEVIREVRTLSRLCKS